MEHQLTELDAALSDLQVAIARMVAECPPAYAGAERRA